jgi:hypothetical protein
MTDANDMKLRSYEFYKEKWAHTKPIRGRSEEVRPIGERRRDWEQVVRVVHANGEESYAAKLYATNVVEYFPNGNILMRTNGYHTPITASFIHEHSPFMCWKQNRQLWVRMQETVYPIGRELLIEPVIEGNKLTYQPVGIKTITKRVVDREKAKAARAAVMPFLNWVKTFFMMSDGWIMHETRKQVVPFNDSGRGFDYTINGLMPSRIYEFICNADEEEYLRLLCELSAGVTSMSQRVAEVKSFEMAGVRQFTLNFYDKQYEFKHFKQRVYKIVEAGEDIHRTIEVMPTNKAMSNAV